MTFSGSFAFGIHAFDSFIRIQCFSSEIHDALNRYIFPPLPRSEAVTTLADIDVRLELRAEQIHILLNEEQVAAVATVRDAVLATIKALDEAIVPRLKSFKAVHAGAVLIQGRALLFPGSSHSGKSSLVAELLRRGESCFSDEYALIDNEGRVHPYPRPLLVRAGRPQQYPVLPEELKTQFVTTPTPIGWILALEYVPGADWKINNISQSEAVTLLLRNTPHEMVQSPQLLDLFLRSVREAKCFSGKRGDAAQAAEEILHLVAASPFSPGLTEC